MAHVMPSLRRESLPTPLLLRHGHVLVPAVDDDDESFVGAFEARSAARRAQGIGGVVQGIENVVLAVAVRVHFGLALFGRRFRLSLALGARRARAGLVVY